VSTVPPSLTVSPSFRTRSTATGFAAVDHDAARRRHDEERRQPAGTHEVDVADDAERVERLAPGRISFGADGGGRGGQQCQEEPAFHRQKL
jgi:hypothetical protein